MRDTRVFRGKDIKSDHFLILSKIDTYTKWKKDKEFTKEQQTERIYETYLLNEDSIKWLDQKRLTKQLEKIDTKNNIKEKWQSLKHIVHIVNR